jgi:hypothetical protein
MGMQNMPVVNVQQVDLWSETAISGKDCRWLCRHQLDCHGELVLWSLVQTISSVLGSARGQWYAIFWREIAKMTISRTMLCCHTPSDHERGLQHQL